MRTPFYVLVSGVYEANASSLIRANLTATLIKLQGSSSKAYSSMRVFVLKNDSMQALVMRTCSSMNIPVDILDTEQENVSDFLAKKIELPVFVELICRTSNEAVQKQVDAWGEYLDKLQSLVEWKKPFILKIDVPEKVINPRSPPTEWKIAQPKVFKYGEEESLMESFKSQNLKVVPPAINPDEIPDKDMPVDTWLAGTPFKH